VDAVEECQVNYFIWSTLPSAMNESNGKWKVPHFDQKFEIEKYAKSKTKLKTICIMLGFYMENFFGNLKPMKQADGSYLLALPIPIETRLDLVDVHDTGMVVSKLLETPDKYVGQTIPICAEVLTVKQVLQTFSKVGGVQMNYKELDKEAYFKMLPPKLAEEMYGMFRFIAEFGLLGKLGKQDLTKKLLNVNLTTFEECLRKNNWRPQ